jgi:hypothetical protein
MLSLSLSGLILLAALPMSDVTTETLQILPTSVRLDVARARQPLLVGRIEKGAWIEDVTGRASFVTDDPRVATVSSEGVVKPIGNGSATVTATVDGRSVHATVSVENIEGDEGWSFLNHVEPVLTKMGCNSGACHGAAAGKNGLRLTLRGYGPEVDYNVLTRQSLARRVVLSAPAESLLLLKPSGAMEHGGGVRFSTDSLEYRVIAEWIAQGADGPSPTEHRLVHLKVYPDAARLKLGARQQILVQAIFSDGRVEDVTRWARFTTADETVAKVDENGHVRIEGHGETSISVAYATRVQTVTITAPYPTELDPDIYRLAPRQNSIDDKNLAKLESLRIAPSGDCGDAVFLRRAYLDATGSLPPATEVVRFLEDKDPEKRGKLVDRLLASEEFVDYWAYKWSDLLLVSSNKLPAPAMWSFYRFVRKSVAENMPWDKFARSVVTAKGETLKNGAANYFVLHRDPIDMTESTSMAFLGLSLTCARCHNHPMEKWTQDQYYGMASLFARVQLKDGDAPGEVIVMPASKGEVRHPRTGAVAAPQPLDAAPLPLEATPDRRETLADWLANPENPYFDRALVNRVWRNFFARGLIEPEDDLRATNPASDEPLLDWLVSDFRAHRRDVKRLIRTIMNSAVYARSSAFGQGAGNGPDPKFLSRYLVKRLPSEVLLDAISRVTGVPTSFAGYPAGWRSLQLPDSKVESTFLDSFGRPERLATCSCERSQEPSMAQALHLANGSTINGKLKDPKGTVAKQVASGASDSALIDRLFLDALSRHPTDTERARLEKALADAIAGQTDPKLAAEARRQVIEDLYWATLTSTEFLFNH